MPIRNESGKNKTVPDPDLEISLGIRRGGSHPDPQVRGGGGGLQKNFIRPFRPQFGLKYGGPGPPGPSSGSSTAMFKNSVLIAELE